MNVLDSVLSAQNGQVLSSLAQRFGLTQDQAHVAVNALVPRLAAGLRSNGGGADSIMGLMTRGDFSHFFHDDDAINTPAATDQGNGVLGQIFGSRDVSRAVAEQSAKQTGIDAGVLKKMLPVLATLILGGLATRLGRPGAASADTGPEAQDGLGAVLGSFLGGPTGAAAQTTLGQGVGGIFDAVLSGHADGKH